MAVHAETRGPIGVLTLDRPDRAHAYDRAHLDALLDGAQRLAAACRVLVIRSTGDRAFCAGADLDQMKEAHPLDALDLRSQRVFTTLARLPCVSVAAVQGAAVAGGFELAMACDLRVIGPKARFWLPETKLGIIPSAGGTTRLSRLVGVSLAKAVILGGATIDADQALRVGLAHRVADDPTAAALTWAEELCARDPVALRLAKDLLDADEPDRGFAGERAAEAILYSRKHG